MSFSKYIIKKLGGFTCEEVSHEIVKVKSDCEAFAVKYMNPKGFSPLMELNPLIGADVSGDIILYVSSTGATNCKAKSFIIAPWAANCTITNPTIKLDKGNCNIKSSSIK